MLACIYLSYIFSIVCGVNIYIYLGSYFVVHSTYFLLFVVPALTGLYCCPHNSLSSTSLKFLVIGEVPKPEMLQMQADPVLQALPPSKLPREGRPHTLEAR